MSETTWWLLAAAAGLVLYQWSKTQVPATLTPAAATGALGSQNLFNLLGSSFD